MEMLDGSNPIGNEIQWTVPRNLFNNKTNKVIIIIYSNYLYPNVKKKRLCSLWVQMCFLLEMDRTKNDTGLYECRGKWNKTRFVYYVSSDKNIFLNSTRHNTWLYYFTINLLLLASRSRAISLFGPET